MTWFTKTTRTYSGETDLDQGTDGSSEYLKSRQIRFIIGSHNTGATVSFKPFITKYSIALSNKFIDQTKDYLNLPEEKIYTTDSIGFEVSVSLDILAHSVNEALVNIKRINELDKIYKSVKHNPSSSSNFLLQNMLYVSLSNILTATTGGDIPDKTTLQKNGVPCFMETLSFSIDKDLGMFEYAGDLLPKKYTMELKFKVSNASYGAIHKGEYLWLPLNVDGENRDGDTKTFPFGITGTRGKIGTDGSQEWTANHKAPIYIGGISNRFFMSFKPFLNSFDWGYSYQGMKITEVDNVGGGIQYDGGSAKTKIVHKLSFSVLSHSVNQGRNNMWKLQKFIRFCDQFYPAGARTADGTWSWPDTTKAKAPSMMLMFNNLNSRNSNDSIISSSDDMLDYSKQYYIKGVSFDFDLSMGMFEDSGMLYFKKYDISLDLEQKGKNAAPYLIRQGDDAFSEAPEIDKTAKSHTATNHKIFS